MNSPRPRIPPSLAPRDEPIDALLSEGPPPGSPPPRRGTFKRVVLWTLLVLTVLFLTPPAVVVALRWVEPPTSAFMLQSEIQPVEYRWVPAGQIPESMRIAVIAAEDQKFWTHWGFDFIAIAEALEHNEKNRKKRGASTITQQTAKNLFLWPSRNWVRKGLEVSFTLLLELELPKERILEIYLNIAEFAPGVYGVEAASQKFFGKAAAEMNPEQTARLVAVLPNPRKWHAGRPGPYVQRRIDWILVHTGQPARFSSVAEAGEPTEATPEAPEPPPGELPPEEGETEAMDGMEPPAQPPEPGAAPAMDLGEPVPGDPVPAPPPAEGGEPATDPATEPQPAQAP